MQAEAAAVIGAEAAVRNMQVVVVDLLLQRPGYMA
jgi:hypothetical protein